MTSEQQIDGVYVFVETLHSFNQILVKMLGNWKKIVL